MNIQRITKEPLDLYDEDLSNMNFNKYQKVSSKTANTDLSTNDMIANYALGLVSEGGEVGDIIKKQLFQGHKADRDKVKDELGDVLWYIANLARMYDIPLEEVATYNILKLKRRFPEGFSADKSINREE